MLNILTLKNGAVILKGTSYSRGKSASLIRTENGCDHVNNVCGLKLNPENRRVMLWHGSLLAVFVYIFTSYFIEKINLKSIFYISSS